VSVWVNRGAKGGAELAAAVRKAFAERAKKLELTSGGSTSWHPVWRYQFPVQAEFWKDLGPFRDQIIEDIRRFWKEFASDLDGLLAKSAS
jgi:hypothetical protein